MNNISLMLETIYKFQSDFSKIIFDLQDQVNQYNNCYNQAYKEIIDYYNGLQQSQKRVDNQMQEQQQCDNTIETLKKRYKELREQSSFFNEKVIQYLMQKFEFDNYYQQKQLQFESNKEIKLFQINPQLKVYQIQLDFFKQINQEANTLINCQYQQFNQHQQLSNFINEQTSQVQVAIKQKEQQQMLIQQSLIEQQKLQEEIEKKKKELVLKKSHRDKNVLQTEIDDNLSEAEELTQLCQECGQIIKFNNFLTTCLHYYHEECILQKIKASYQNTSIFCSCNTLINSKMIQDVLEKSQQDKNRISFEDFLQYQIKQLLNKSNKNITVCKRCQFFYISQEEQQIESCTECNTDQN